MKIFVPKLNKYSTNAALIINGAKRETSQINLCKELGLESLRFRRWFQLAILYFFKKKIMVTLSIYSARSQY